jgi:hypothetical protein
MRVTITTRGVVRIATVLALLGLLYWLLGQARDVAAGRLMHTVRQEITPGLTTAQVRSIALRHGLESTAAPPGLQLTRVGWRLTCRMDVRMKQDVVESVDAIVCVD